MAITLEEITERIKSRINETVSSDIQISELRHWVHPKLFEIFKERLPHIKWYGEIIENISPSATGIVVEGIGYIHSTKIITIPEAHQAIMQVNGMINWKVAFGPSALVVPIGVVDAVISNTKAQAVVAGNTALPDGFVIEDGNGVAIFMKNSGSSSTIDLTPYDYYNLIKVVGPDGFIVKAKNEEELDIVPQNKTVYENQIRWWEFGRKLLFAKGEGASYPDWVNLWVNRNPIKALKNSDILDMPDDWEEVLVGLVAAVALKKLEGRAEEATKQRNEALALLTQMGEADLKRKILEKAEEEE